MVQFVDNLATYLQTNGHGTLGTDLFKGSTPDRDDGAFDNAITVTDAGGEANVLNEKGASYEEIVVQIRARDKRQEKARDALLSIQALLHQIVATDLGTFTIVRGTAVDRPSVIGRDDKERWNLVSNYEFLVRLS
jgi:hypothetical protein